MHICLKAATSNVLNKVKRITARCGSAATISLSTARRPRCHICGGINGIRPAKPEISMPHIRSAGKIIPAYLRHTFSPEAFIVSEGQTQNLMDYTGGTELWQHQWRSVQDSESVLFAFMQDEGEGEYYAKTGEDNWNLIINKIACSNQNKETQVRLDGLGPDIRGGFDLSGIGRVSFRIPEMSVGKNDNLVDLKNVKVTEMTNSLEVVYRSVSEKYRIFFHVPIYKKDEFLAVLNHSNSSYFEKLINDIPTEESRAVYSLLSRLPECSYRMINTNNRIKYLEWLTDEFYINEDQEVMIIDLLRYIDDKTGLFEALYSKPLLVSGLVSRCSENNKQIVLNEKGLFFHFIRVLPGVKNICYVNVFSNNSIDYLVMTFNYSTMA